MGACIGRGPPPLPPSRPVGKDTVVKEAKAGGKGGWETAGLGAAHGSSGPSVAIMLPPSEAPFYCKVVLSKNDITVKYGEGHMLYPEEACYLVEKGALQILRNADAEKRFDEKVSLWLCVTNDFQRVHLSHAAPFRKIKGCCCNFGGH
jgi:hypothetical protein